MRMEFNLTAQLTQEGHQRQDVGFTCRVPDEALTQSRKEDQGVFGSGYRAFL